MRALRAVTVAAVLALLGLLVWDVAHDTGGGVASKVDKGKVVAAPALHLPRLDTPGRLTLASLRGKVVVVNFWESYCIPCKQEARAFAAASRRWKGKGVVFVGVNAFDTKSAARGYLARYHVPYANVHDGVGASFAHWGVTAAFTPSWYVPPDFKRVFNAESFEIEGSDLSVGFVRGREEGGAQTVEFRI